MQHTNTYKKESERTRSMLGKLNAALHAIMPHMSDATSGIINKIGLLSVAVGGTNAIVSEAIESQDPTWLTVAGTTGLLSSIGAIVFILRIIASFSFDMYFKRRKDQREQEAHEKRMREDDTPTP